MGIVTYTIPESYLESVNTTRHHYACNFIIEVPIGAVAPTVSRESLSKEEKTDKALGEIMRTITTNVIQTFKQELKEFKKRDDVFKSLYLFYKYDILRKYVLPNQLNLTSYFPFYKDFNKIKHKAYHVRSNGIPEKISKNDIFTLLEGNRLTVDDIITVTHDIMERTPSLTKLRGKVILFIEDSSTQYPDVEDFKKYVATIPKQSVQKVKRHSVKVSMYEGKYVVTKKEQERFRTLLNKIEPCNHVIATVQDINYLKKINTDCFYIDDFIKTNAKKAKKLYIECFIHDYIFYNNFLKTFLKIRTEKIQEIAEYNRLMDQFPTVIRYLRQVIQINDTNYVCYLNENDLKPFGIDVIKIQSAIQKRIDKFLSDYPFIKYLEAKTPYYMVSDYVSFQKSKQGVENGNHSR
jgi:hypothetical protein